MAYDNSKQARVELSDEVMDVAGGRMSMGEAMAEAQQDKLQGGKGNFFMIWLKNLFNKNNANINAANDPLQDTFDSIVDNYQGGTKNL